MFQPKGGINEEKRQAMPCCLSNIPYYPPQHVFGGSSDVDGSFKGLDREGWGTIGLLLHLPFDQIMPEYALK